MNKKLTLNIDENLISFAHEYSKAAHSSLSSIIENFILSLKKTNSTNDIQFANRTNQLVGAFKNNIDFILTYNLKDFSKSRIKAMTPGEFLLEEHLKNERL